ncbi:MAG: hypothetical protein QOE22_25 [Candidatus Parcubacteria bacterium]|jgi:drug/metabolite transporter (DMT)-like permease|nr:hypothetical protein [Candidatus Parcubacteria bacterium]
MSFIQTGLIILAVSAVAIADVFLRKTQSLGSFSKALTSPWLMGAVALYILQIAIFTYLFSKGAELSYVGVLQVVFYALIVLIAAVVLFKEPIGTLQIVGTAFALIGVVLMSL